MTTKGRVLCTEEFYDNLKQIIGNLPSANVRRLIIELRAGEPMPFITAELYAMNELGTPTDRTRTDRFRLITQEEYDDLIEQKGDRS